jgi:hypothetical protein
MPSYAGRFFHALHLDYTSIRYIFHANKTGIMDGHNIYDDMATPPSMMATQSGIIMILGSLSF